MTGKLITQEQIDSLPSFTQIPHNRQFVLLSDLRALYDNAPSVCGEAVGEIKITWYNDTGFEYGIKLYGLELRTQKEYEQWIKKNFKGEGVFKLYTTPQPDRVAELENILNEQKCLIESLNSCIGGKGSLTTDNLLHCVRQNADNGLLEYVAELEAKLKEYEQAIEAMVEDGWLLCGHEGLSEPQQKVYDVYQAMKGGA